ncbi:MAG TPA: hypothetical protein EYG57_19595 [Planctomycetes bacterium]|nr:hypothetical protein [Planctomycetota bacterium]
MKRIDPFRVTTHGKTNRDQLPVLPSYCISTVDMDGGGKASVCVSEKHLRFSALDEADDG